MSQQHKFQINLRGMIDLLSHHLYSGPHVFVRELLQNGIDAIRAREQIEPSCQGRIDIQLISGSDDTLPTLVFEDNGVGLTEEEVHRFLATIGESSKRDTLAEQRTQFIGQFGIGLLSCFMVADEIVVVTRSAREDGPAIEWRGKPDGTYEVRPLSQEITPGTRIYLRARPEMFDYFTKDRLHQLLEHFGDLLPIPIHFTVGDHTSHINNRVPPWEQAYALLDEERQAYLSYGKEILGQEFFDYIPLHSEEGGVIGAAYILPHPTSPNARGQHRVYLKGMLLSDKVEELLPRWAVFVRCIVNTDKLRPVASREGFYENEELEATREALGKALRDWLLQLAKTAPDRLERLISVHHLAIRGLAAHDAECFRVFVDLLPIETTLGHMTLGTYRSKYDVLRYTPTLDVFRQIAQVAASQNLCIINAGYVYDEELLRMLGELNPELKMERLDAASLAQQLEDLTIDEREKAFELLRIADVVLQPFHCSSDIKKFAPNTLPTLYTTNAEGDFFRQAENTKDVTDSIWSGIIDAVTTEIAPQSYAQLCFNYDNPLVRRLINLGDRQLLKRTVEMLYVQALLLGHHPLSVREMSLLNEGLLGLIEAALDQGGKMDE